MEPQIRSIVPDWSGAARVEFDEPIIAGQIPSALVGSPASRYDVNVGRSQIRIRPLTGDWLPGAIYYLTIPEGVADLLGNRTQASIDLLFSTGPEFSGSLIEGTLLDRISGGPVVSGRVIFLATSGDSVPYSAVTGPDGRFSLPETPFGEYKALAFVDRNASLFLERQFESYDSLVFTIDADSTAVDLEFRLTEPDSTPPVLVSVSVVDSLTLRLEFDDHLDPRQAWDPQNVRVVLEGTDRTWPVEALKLGDPQAGRTPPGPARIGGGDEGGAALDSLAVSDSLAVPDSLVAPDSLAAPDSLFTPVDSAAVPPDSAALPADSLEAPAVDQLEIASDTLPATVLSAELGDPLATGRYRVTATGILNLRNLVGGGDTTFVYPPPDSLSDEGVGP